MKKILIVILIFCVGLIGISVRSHSESETDFALLLRGKKIISPDGSYETGKSSFNPNFVSFVHKTRGFFKRKTRV